MKIRQIIKDVFLKSTGNVSYAQCGEDLIIDFIFSELKIASPNYLDLGAHHPSYLNNTYKFYLKGSRGVNVEPDITLMDNFYKQRPNDININAGVGINSLKESDFYLMSAKTLNTFSKSEAYKIQEEGSYKIEKVVKVKLITANELLEHYFSSTGLDLLSIDVEGIDFEIVRGLNYQNFRPKIICAETLEFAGNRKGKKSLELINFIKDQGYMYYADTYINTIFVDQNIWDKI